MGIDDITLNVRVADPERRSMLDHWRMGRGRLGMLASDGFRDLWAPHTAFWYPSTGTLSVDVKRERKGRLVPAGDVVGVAQTLYGVLVDSGLIDRGSRPYATGEMTCSRVDVAMDVRMPSGQDGLDLLKALESMREWGGLYVDGYGRPGERTVYHKRSRRSGRDRIVARVYSRHREEVGCSRGEVVRFELEQRFKPGVPARDLTSPKLRDMWVRHFVGMAPSNGKVRVGEREAVLVQLAERVASGEITHREFEQAAVFVQLEKLGLLGEVYPARLVKERRRLVKRLGVSVDQVEDVPVDVDVGAIVAMGIERSNW